MVARDRIELPTRGFSVQTPNPTKPMIQEGIFSDEVWNISWSYAEISPCFASLP